MPSEVYINLYRSNRTAIGNGACDVLNAPRDAALEAFEKYGLPDARLEEYLHTGVSGLFDVDWGMNVNRIAMPMKQDSSFRCNVPNLGSALYYMNNDSFVPTPETVKLPDGVIAGGLKEVAIKYPDLISGHYAGIADMDRPGIAALNTMFAQDGFVVYVPDGVEVPRPMQLVTLLQSPVEMMSTRRILVILGRGARLRLLLCDHSVGAGRCLVNQVTEIYAGTDSSLELYDIEETSQTAGRVTETFIRQEAGSSVDGFVLTLNNGATRNSVFADLVGKGAGINLSGAGILGGRQNLDTYTVINHPASDCRSNELFKYVLDDEAIGAFSGKILVREGAQNIVSQQTNRNICLKNTARMFTRPQLEIYADDVKCGHGATVGQLDERAMFYMRQRGIPEDEARTLLMLAFMDEIISGISQEPLRQKLRMLVERRLKGIHGACEGCMICK